MSSPSVAASATQSTGGRRFARRAIRVLLFAIGVAVLAVILATVGWRSVAVNLGLIGWWFPVLVVLYGLAELSFTYGWKVIIGRRPGGPVRFSDTFAAYMASSSVNYFTAVGGEPVRASLLAPKIGYAKALATATVHRHGEMTSQFIFLLLGAGVSLIHFDLPAPLRYAALGSLVLFGAVILWMTIALRHGAFVAMLDRLARGPLKRLNRFRATAEKLDERIGEIYERRAEHFLESVGWCFLGWCGGLLETYIVIRLLSPKAGFYEAIAIETLAMLINTFLFFIPGRIGTAEGVRTALWVLVGFSAAEGIAYGLVRRARELVWLVPGIVVLLKRHLLDIRHLHLTPDASVAEEAR
ncbi:MAG: flippase-like domain-containing protein [Thermoanaerobaculia bacterium]